MYTMQTRRRNGDICRRDPPQGMLIISFDPGVSTGIAVISESDDPPFTAVFSGLPGALLETITDLQGKYPDAKVVAEQPPQHTGNYRQHTQQVEELIRRAFPQVEWIQPSQWKGHPASITSDLRGKTQHEKDAVGLGRWYRRRESARSRVNGQDSTGVSREGG